MKIYMRLELKIINLDFEDKIRTSTPNDKVMEGEVEDMKFKDVFI